MLAYSEFFCVQESREHMHQVFLCGDSARWKILVGWWLLQTKNIRVVQKMVMEYWRWPFTMNAFHNL